MFYERFMNILFYNLTFLMCKKGLKLYISGFEKSFSPEVRGPLRNVRLLGWGYTVG